LFSFEDALLVATSGEKKLLQNEHRLLNLLFNRKILNNHNSSYLCCYINNPIVSCLLNFAISDLSHQCAIMLADNANSAE
jgi:hypothetical protein